MRATCAAAMMAVGAIPSFGLCQAYPTKPVRVIMTVTGGAEGMVRLLANKVGDALGQPLIVEQQSGAGGSAGAELVARSAPDGHTILYTGASSMSIRQFIAKNTRYDALRDFTPIIRMSEVVLHISVTPGLPVRSIPELIDYARRNPGKLSYGTSGIGTSHHLSAELLRMITGIDWVHVPYKGAPPVITDLMTGRIQVGFGTISTIVPVMNSGKIRVIAINNGSRFHVLPNVATVPEQLPGYVPPPAWTGYFGPAGIPQPIVRRLYTEYARAASTPEARAKADDLGYFYATGTPEELAESVRSDIANVGRIVKAAGIQAE